MKPLVIYHGNCADGFGAAWAIHSKHPDWEFYPGHYGEEPPDVHNRYVILVDFSYSRDQLLLMSNEAKSILILDHHKSAEKDLEEFTGQHFELGKLPTNDIVAIFDMLESGAMMAWNYFHHNQEPPKLLQHIQDRDLWQFKLAGTKEISAALFSYPYSFKVWDELMQSDCLSLACEGEAIMKKQTKDIKKLLPQITRHMEIGDVRIPVANLPYQFASEAGAILCKEQPFAATYFDTKAERVFSLRSDAEFDYSFDVSEVAKCYGGGGHKHAAGFKVPRNHKLARV